MANAATWAKRVTSWRASGLTAAEFSDGRDFAAASLRWWSSRLGSTRTATSPRPMPMARVLREPCSPPWDADQSPAAILVELAGARVLVPRGADPETLACVLEALEARTRGGAR